MSSLFKEQANSWEILVIYHTRGTGADYLYLDSQKHLQVRPMEPTELPYDDDEMINLKGIIFIRTGGSGQRKKKESPSQRAL